MIFIHDGIHVRNKPSNRKSMPESSPDDIQAELNRIKYNLELFKKLAAGSAALECIAILSKQVHALALVVERMYHDSL